MVCALRGVAAYAAREFVRSGALRGVPLGVRERIGCFGTMPTDWGSRKVVPHAIEPVIDGIIGTFPAHPFRKGVNHENLRQVLRAYYAMSMAFPYLQSGAYAGLAEDRIRKGDSFTKEDEHTFVVGAFLSFDETGGNYLLRKEGIEALPRLLETHRLFHASLLREDIVALLGEELKPDFSGPTGKYLLNLMKSLGAKDPVERAAAMVAFEMHAGEMIASLWDSLSRLFPEVRKESLAYFETHVGGDDPQEEYHKELTRRLTAALVPPDRVSDFGRFFAKFYRRNSDWCREICEERT